MKLRRPHGNPLPAAEHRARMTKDDLLCWLEMQQTRNLQRIQWLEGLRQGWQQSSQTFENLYDSQPIGYLLLDSKGFIQNANAAIEAMLGLKRDRLFHVSIAVLLRRGDALRLLGRLSQLASSDQQRAVIELEMHNGQHKNIAVQFTIVPMNRGEGRRLFLAAVVDLTEGRNQREMLADTRDFAETIVQTVRHPLAVLDGELRIVSVNKAFAEFFHRPEKYMQGRVVEVLLNLWWSGNRLRQELEKVLLTDAPLENYRLEIEPPEVGKRILFLNARKMQQRPGKPVNILIALEDVTAREQAREQLQRLNEELERRVVARTEALQSSYRQMEAFCYSIAHDLRAPLRSITGFSQILRLRHYETLRDEGKSYCDRIENGAARMNRLISDLLDYGRLNTVALPEDEIELDAVFDYTVEQLNGDIEEKKAKIEKESPLPRVRANRSILQIAFTNLMSNALKFTPRGVQPWVRIRAEPRDDCHRVWIADNGIGIPRECHETIFGVFQRLHTSDSIYPGTGIGLALVKKGIERIGGRVGVESEPGKGSRFWMELKPASAEA